MDSVGTNEGFTDSMVGTDEGFVDSIAVGLMDVVGTDEGIMDGDGAGEREDWEVTHSLQSVPTVQLNTGKDIAYPVANTSN